MSKTTPHIRFKGDKKRAKNLVRLAKQHLFVTDELAKRMGVKTYRRTLEVDTATGTVIHTGVHYGVSTIYIIAPTIVPVVEPETVSEAEVEPAICLGFYSGLAYNHVALTSTLEDFNPTSATREAFGSKPASVAVDPEFISGVGFQPVERLAVPVHPDASIFQGFTSGPNAGDGQTDTIHPCQYSGALAEVCSVVLGLGNANLTGAERVGLLPTNTDPGFTNYVNSDGFLVQYKWRWDETTGLIKSESGEWWVIEIGQYRGIIARRLPLLNVAICSADSDGKKFLAEYGGLPSGEGLPSSTSAVNAGIAEGWILELMSADDLGAQFYDNETASADYTGWCFSPDGRAARVTAFDLNDSDGWNRSTYWELIMSINSSGTNGYAYLTLLDRSVVANGRNQVGSGYIEGNGGGTLWVYNPENDNRYTSTNLYSYSNAQYTAEWANLPDLLDAVIWVGWIGGQWHEIHFRGYKQSSIYYTFWFQQPTSEGFTGRLEQARDVDLTFAGGNWYRKPKGYSSVFDESINWKTTQEYGGHHVITSATNFIPRREGTHSSLFSLGPAWQQEWYSVNNSRPSEEVVFHLAPFNRNAYFIANGTLDSGAYISGEQVDVLAWHQAKPFSSNPKTGFKANVAAYNGSTPNWTWIPTSAPFDTSYYNSNNQPAGAMTNGVGDQVIVYYKGLSFEQCVDGHPFFWVTSTTTWGEGTALDNSGQNSHPSWAGPEPQIAGTETICAEAAGGGDIPTATIGDTAFGKRHVFPSKNYIRPVSYTSTTYLVADLPDNKVIRTLGTSDNEDLYYAAMNGTSVWCQMSTFGKPGAIYTDFSKLDPDDPFDIFPLITATGEHPSLPENPTDSLEYKKLTFVGVNDKSNP